MNIAVTVWVKRIHGPYELVSARGFVLFTRKGIGQLGKGWNFITNGVVVFLKYDGNYHW